MYELYILIYNFLNGGASEQRSNIKGSSIRKGSPGSEIDRSPHRADLAV